MCILIHHTAKTSFTDEMLRDFYSHNPDGFGVMYGDGKKIHVTKSLGSVDEVMSLYRDICEGRDCIIHYRMKTHGNIDTANCHPYRVTDELWMAHNGILSAGNPIRKEMSDTWHIIEYIIRPIAQSDVDLIFTPEFQDYLGDLIGSSNKFAFCHADGRTAVINRDAGVEYMDAWLSNTYAWSSAKHGFGYKSKTYPSYPSYYSNTLGYDNNWSLTSDEVAPTKKSSATTRKQFNYRKVCRAAYNSWMRGSSNLVDWVEQAPDKAKFLLQEWYSMDDDEVDEMVDASPQEAADWIADLIETDSLTVPH